MRNIWGELDNFSASPWKHAAEVVRRVRERCALIRTAHCRSDGKWFMENRGGQVALLRGDAIADISTAESAPSVRSTNIQTCTRKPPTGSRHVPKTIFTHDGDKEKADGTVKKTKVKAGDDAMCRPAGRQSPKHVEGEARKVRGINRMSRKLPRRDEYNSHRAVTATT